MNSMEHFLYVLKHIIRIPPSHILKYWKTALRSLHDVTCSNDAWIATYNYEKNIDSDNTNQMLVNKQIPNVGLELNWS